ncbi:MAG: M56 family metallopeptidase [Dysosmobacter sp.]|uniref:M56 family metallopeptidase n=1 Tax=uncultured Oscillibacter sp. TaxID=876091 RepID=UPI002606842F|nr:M56 family metallopeptidase [uncultured Oscillibacter sp.]MCX4371853.1 M56 family metallopeptidase [Dysosmobacter sp.]
MMNTLAGMGLAGSAVLALWLLASRVLKNCLPARWHYRILKTSLFFFLVPVGRLLPLAGRVLSALRPAPAVVAPAPAPAVPDIPMAVLPQLPMTAPAAPALPPVPAPEPFAVTAETLRTLAVIWAVGAAGMLAYKAYVYFRLRRRVFRQNRPVSSHEAQLIFWSCKRQLGVRGLVDLRENPAAPSPFAAGLLRPMVVIPAVSLEKEEMRYLFLHELTHIKCGDLWVRFLAMLAQAVHWYNPFAYLLCRSIQTVSEQSCDERVACPLPAEERYVYGNAILKLAVNAAAGSGDWAASLSTRESIERRLTRVLKTEKLKGSKRLLALTLAIAILACGGGAALAARNPLTVSREAGETPRTVPTVQTGDTAKTGGDAVRTGAAAPAVTDAPTEAQVLEARSLALAGMSAQQVQKLTEIVKAANLCLEHSYLYGDFFGKLEDPESLYWNYFDRTGEIQISWAYDGELDMESARKQEGLTESEFYAKYGTKVVTTNRYDAKAFISLLETLRGGVQNEVLRADLQYLMDETALAKETHAMEHANNIYKKLHDLDYFLLRYGPTDMGIYVEDPSTVSKYYGTLSYYGEDAAKLAEPEPAESVEPEAPEEPAEPDKPVTTYDAPSGETLAMIRREFAAIWPEDNITDRTPILFGNKDLILRHGGTILPDNDPDAYRMKDDGIHKVFIDKNGRLGDEYLVGNRNAVDPREAWMLDTLTPDGDYPKNSRGESYGHINLFAYVGYWPDLEYLAEYPYEGRPAGYIYSRDDANSPLNRYDPDAAQKPRTQTDSAAYKTWRAANPSPTAIPLYDSEGKIIGSYDYGAGADLDFSGMDIEEAKAAAEALFDAQNAE